MELLYIWIESYKNIENQGFNFSPKYRFDYNHETKELTCEEKQGLSDDFFGKNITNVTAIIGANGSGKTTLLESLQIRNEHRGSFFILSFIVLIYTKIVKLLLQEEQMFILSMEIVNGNTL